MKKAMKGLDQCVLFVSFERVEDSPARRPRRHRAQAGSPFLQNSRRNYLERPPRLLVSHEARTSCGAADGRRQQINAIRNTALGKELRGDPANGLRLRARYFWCAWADAPKQIPRFACAGMARDSRKNRSQARRQPGQHPQTWRRAPRAATVLQAHPLYLLPRCVIMPTATSAIRDRAAPRWEGVKSHHAVLGVAEACLAHLSGPFSPMA